jgi:hypothetical protein
MEYTMNKIAGFLIIIIGLYTTPVFAQTGSENAPGNTPQRGANFRIIIFRP